jgi:hypothetical protein
MEKAARSANEEEEQDPVGKAQAFSTLAELVADIFIPAEPGSVNEPHFHDGLQLIVVISLLTPEIPQALQFIVETGKSRPKGEALRLIRTQARRRKPKHSLSSKPLHPSLHANNKANQTKTPSKAVAFRVLNRIVPKSPSPNHGPLINRFDPFNVLPVDERGNSHYLIHQCRLDASHVSDRKHSFIW